MEIGIGLRLFRLEDGEYGMNRMGFGRYSGCNYYNSYQYQSFGYPNNYGNFYNYNCYG